VIAPDDEAGAFSARILHPADADDSVLLDRLRQDSRIEFIDHRAELLKSLRLLCPSPHAETLAEPTSWAYYPWRRAVVGVLGPRAHRALRLDRNRHLITAEEQDRLNGLRIGIAGLSVGHVIAHTLAAEGLCGTVRLADFDDLELTNLNRVPATMLDIGVNKAVVAARRIAELDPYIHLDVMTAGVTPDSLREFLDDIDIVVEECDSLDVKIMIREAARERRLPVLMATSDRGLVDIERYDLEPARPILHGLLGQVDATFLASLPSRDKLPYMLRHADASRSSPRLIASLVEVTNTLSTWPQLAADVTLGAAVVAEAVRRIGLQQPLRSGQTRIDVGQALDDVAEPPPAFDGQRAHKEAADDEESDATPTGPVAAVAQAAIRAPSGGNAQPWHVEARPNSVVIRLAPERTSMMDVGFRGSAVAIGAALFNAKVAAAAWKVLGPTVWKTDGVTSPLEVALRLDHGDDAELADLYQPMLRRETNRHLGASEPIAAETVMVLQDIARREGGRLSLLQAREDIDKVASIFAAADRIRYLTPHLHKEMISELRWPGDEPADTGIDVRSLELDPADLALLDVLRRADVMAELAQWNAGEALGNDVRERIRASSAVGVITVHGHELTDFAYGGSAVEAVWVVAQGLGLAVQPISPVFLHAVYRGELLELSQSFATALQSLQADFRQLAGTKEDESQVLVLKFAHARRASVRSRRRGFALHIEEVLGDSVTT
jgi:molybdopterin/thiamine biosynthesis adenylyltransferase